MRRTATLVALAAGCALAAAATQAAPLGVPGTNGLLVFQSSNRGGHPDAEIWLRTAHGKLVDLTRSGGTDESPVVSPDGRSVAFDSDRAGNRDIWVMSIAGTSQRRLTTDPKDDAEPTWSPDGRQIAFTSWRDGHSEIYVMNADGSGQHRLTDTPARSSNEEPSWSPDGTRIAFSSNNGQQGIYEMSPDGSNVRLVAPATVINTNPDWSPDSTRIAYAYQNDIWVVPSTGGTPTNLTRRGITAAAPAWSPNGSTIAFWSRPTQTGNDDEFTVPAAGGPVTALTNDAADDRAVDWQAADPLTSVAVGSSGCPARTVGRPGRIQWNFTGSAPHTAVDATGLGLFDAGSHTGPFTFWSTIPAAGEYKVDCGAGATAAGIVDVPVAAAPSKGRRTTAFSITWALRPAPAGFVYDVQVRRPGSSGFAPWQTGAAQPGARFKAAAPGRYDFEARLRRSAGGAATGFSPPVAITISGAR